MGQGHCLNTTCQYPPKQSYTLLCPMDTRLQVGLGIPSNDSSSPEDRDQFPWKKWMLWRVNYVALHPSEIPILPMLHLPISRSFQSGNENSNMSMEVNLQTLVQ